MYRSNLYSLLHSNKHFNIYVLYAFIFSNKRSIPALNLIISLKLSTVQLLNKFLKPTCAYKPVKALQVYNKVVKYVSTSFLKNRVNSLVYINIINLLLLYKPSLKTVTSTSINVWLNHNFYFITFINLFYFKIRNL